MVQIDTPEQMLANPADDYVKKFIHNVNTSKVFCVRNIMSTPSCIVKDSDGANTALTSMRANGVSSAYVVGDHMNFIGIVTLEGALAVREMIAVKPIAVIFARVPIIDPYNVALL